MGDMAVMVIILERDLPMLTATTEDILEGTDMAAMAITLERDPPKLKAITEDILEDTDTEVMDITLERDLPKASHTTEVMVDMVTVDTGISCRKIDLICHLFIWLSDFIPFYDVVIYFIKFQQKKHKIKICRNSYIWKK